VSGSPKILIVTGEFSGNLYGAQVAEHLEALHPGCELHGVGCSQMQEAGVELLYDNSSWGAVGIVEAAKRPQLLWVYLRLKRWIREERPDVLLLLDYPGFNMALTRFAKSLGIPTVYFFPPGKHTSNPAQVTESAKQIARVAAPLLTTYDLYRTAGANVEMVGHPLIDVMQAVPPRDEARAALGFSPEDTLVGILPGSRLQEIRTHTPLLVECVRKLATWHPRTWFVLPKVRLRQDFLERKIDHILDQVRASGLPVKIVEGRSHEVMAASDALLIASGTATLEAAYLMKPMVIFYRVSKLTEILASLFYKRFPKYIGLPNILADREIVPERIQHDFQIEEVVGQVGRYLDDPPYRARVVEDLRRLRESLGPPGSAAKVARMVLEEAGVAVDAAPAPVAAAAAESSEPPEPADDGPELRAGEPSAEIA